MTRVVHCKKEPFDVYIGRPSYWGNPYSHRAGTRAREIVSSREEAIRMYEDHVRGNPLMLERLSELKDKTLGCWCKPQPCHGDVLVKLIEERLL